LSIPLSVNGAVFNYPVNFDTNWGIDATGWAQAVTAGMLQKAGGNFPLTADVNFGTSFGLISPYYKSSSTNIAAAGVIRLAKTDTLSWRNNANSADLPLGVNGTDQLTFNGSSLSFTGAVNAGTQFQLAYYAATGNTVSGLTLITPSRALQSDINGLPVASGVSSATLAFLDATSSVQTQLNSISTVANAALPKTGGTMSGAIAMGANKITGLANGTVASDAAAFGQVPTNLPPTGSITMFGGASAPTGWLLCDGTSYTTAGQPALFAVIGYTFGGGGANFNVPNFTNNVPVGSGSIVALGGTAGTQTHSISVAEMPTHSHGVTDAGHQHTFHTYTTTGANGTLPVGQTGTEQVGSPTFGPVSAAVTGITINNTGSGTAMSLVQPSLGITYIIKS
jgi:microcystin-dependent protein